VLANSQRSGRYWLNAPSTILPIGNAATPRWVGTAAKVEQALSRLALAADSLGYHGIQPTRLCWVFEHARIHVALRRDAACLAFFVENGPGTSPKLEGLLEEFARLPAL
jgi:hypothetical protein